MRRCMEEIDVSWMVTQVAVVGAVQGRERVLEMEKCNYIRGPTCL